MTAGFRLPELSVVVPVHNEEGNVRPLFAAVCAALEPLGRPFEVVLVDDGSSDATGELLDGLAVQDRRLRPLHLDGNFGQAAALCAGFEAARGAIILTLDGDLQNDPADMPHLLALLEDGGYRAVSGWRRRREGSWARRVLPSVVANWLIARVTGVPSKDNGCGLKAYRSEVVKGVYLPRGLHRFIPAIFGVRADEFAQVEVADRPRHTGRSHYGLSRFFVVVRDLMAVPYLLAGPDRSLSRVNTLILLAVMTLCAGVALLLGMRRSSGAGLALIGLGALFHAYSVRGNLQRWLRAQRKKPFRIRCAGGPADPGAHTEASPVPGGRQRV